MGNHHAKGRCLNQDHHTMIAWHCHLCKNVVDFCCSPPGVLLQTIAPFTQSLWPSGGGKASKDRHGNLHYENTVPKNPTLSILLIQVVSQLLAIQPIWNVQISLDTCSISLPLVFSLFNTCKSKSLKARQTCEKGKKNHQ